jgi:hypothetical protein
MTMPQPNCLKAALILLFVPLFLTAQNTNSPYSRFGYGQLEHQALGKTKGMGNVGIGMRDRNAINPLNPASYSALDTMTMLFDFGVNASMSTYREPNAFQGRPNGGLDYVAMKIPLKRWWGVAIGLQPFSKVGYGYSYQGTLTNGTTYTEAFAGSGGMTTLFLGTSVALWKNLGVGINYKYYSGLISQSSGTAFSDNRINSSSRSEYWHLNGSSLDVGLQYQQTIDPKNKLVFGVTFSEKMPLNNEVILTNLTTDTTTITRSSTFELPRTLGAGLSWVYDDRLTLALDYRLEQWSGSAFKGVTDSLTNRSQLSVGMEYLPSYVTNRYYKAIKYRLGATYSNSYIGNDVGDLRNIGLTVGFGLPLRGNQRSALNVAFEVGKLLPPRSDMVNETYYKVSIGMTFNESWFFKRKL